MKMYTDPNHLRVEDPGDTKNNTVFIYLEAFSNDEHFKKYLPEFKNLNDLKQHYEKGGVGDVKIKKFLNEILNEELEPIRQRRKELEQNIDKVYEILREGSIKAKEDASKTLEQVKHAMKIDYFSDNSFIKEQQLKFEK